MIEKLIEELLIYANKNLDLKGYDIIYSRNILMSLFDIIQPYDKNLTEDEIAKIESLEVPDYFIERITKYSKEKKLCKEGMEFSFATQIMAILSPNPEKTVQKFIRLKDKQNIETACSYLYNLSIKNNYIQKSAIDRNIVWRADFAENFLEITINLSKPEKDNKEILKQLKQPASAYPKCMLCIDNKCLKLQSKH